MKITDKLKDLEEYKEQYLTVHEEHKLAKLNYAQTSNSTAAYLLKEMSYEKRKLLILELKSAGCPETHLLTISKLNERIYEEYQDNFDQHKCKQAVFDFYNLVSQAESVINSISSNKNRSKISKFLSFKIGR
ncbi:hypothetical protein METH109765_09400 [Mesobacillus thioparans]